MVLARLKILIVEDEFFIALDAEEQAKALGHTVVGIAVSAAEAIRLAELQRPDVALMDIRLVGETDGIEAAREIGDRFGVATIFVTANTDPPTVRRAQSVNPVGVLEKPLTKDRLEAQLERIPAR
jgi:CheY-like chemotaxis protein